MGNQSTEVSLLLRAQYKFSLGIPVKILHSREFEQFKQFKQFEQFKATLSAPHTLGIRQN